jgi:hypothetical protein
MRRLRFWRRLLAHFLKVVAYEWIFAFGRLVSRFWRGLKNLFKTLTLPHPEREEAGPDCTIVDNPSLHRPDPCIYSQDYLLQLGLAVTWDNPDIVLRRNGVVVPEGDVLPDTDYAIEATVWNNSYEAPAVGVRVAFSFLSFGVATIETPIGTAFVNLGVKGGVNHPALATMPWRTPATPGHYCLKATLGWVDDANPANNVGQNNLNVVAPQSPADFRFRLRNATGKPAEYTFETDTYVLGQPPPCPDRILPRDRGTFSERLRRTRQSHGRGGFPLPAGWTVTITPPQPLLQADQEIDVDVRIEVPPGFAGRQHFNVRARTTSGYAGGVTLIVATV